MTLTALLIDVDGTLVDTEELHRQAYNQAFLELALSWVWMPAEYAGLLSISGGADRIDHYIEHLPVAPALKARYHQLTPAIHQHKTRIYAELVGSNAVKLRPGIRRLIDEARAAGLKIGLAASSASDSAQRLVHNALGVNARNLVDAIACADQVSKRKPAPDLYRLLLATMRVDAMSSIALEDSHNGVLAAKAAGLVTIATPSRWTAQQNFDAADLVLPSLGDPSAPLDASHAAALRGSHWVSVDVLIELLRTGRTHAPE